MSVLVPLFFHSPTYMNNMSLNLYLIRTRRTNAEGNQLDGKWRNQMWVNGFAGPFDYNTARRIARINGCEIYPMGSLGEDVVRAAIEAILKKEVDDEKKRLETIHSEAKAAEAAVKFEAAMAAQKAAAQNGKVKENALDIDIPDVDPDILTYRQKLKILRLNSESFHWGDFTEGKMDKTSINKAFERLHELAYEASATDKQPELEEVE